MTNIIEEWIDEETGHQIARYENGVIRDVTRAKNIRGADNALITPENARDMLARKKQIAIISQLRGLAKSRGVDVPIDTELERIAELAGDAVEALTMHMAKTFTESKNLRGMAESYGKLLAPLTGESRTEEAPEKRVSLLEALGRETVEALLARAREIREARGG